MIRVFIFGISGKMGQILAHSLPDDFVISGCANSSRIDEAPSDVIIDFSSAAATAKVTALSDKLGCPLVIATTGQSAEDNRLIKECATHHAVLKSGNMSIGINLMLSLCASLKGIGKCEIIETHHAKKKDAPSGTALMLKSAAGAQKIHSLRLGSVVGEHQVIFGLENETITLTHSAADRRLFADGAIKAARWLINQPYGLYSFNDFLSSEKHHSLFHSER
ncbi:MAG: 4-hydroxy-tetrahydrodipicolinate reductase [Clostridiales bacterium]|nr:4-hydroxy-tetrahydrodipicolinate reductase [Clostridiales bacterium]